MKIDKLTLFSTNLSNQLELYKDVFGFSCIVETSNNIGFQIGESQLWFEKSTTCRPAHFAFNIPYPSIQKAKEWLVSKGVNLLTFEGKETIEFLDWEALALYFKDADGNIVELIGRKRLDYSWDGIFGADDIKGLSEIAIATTDIESNFQLLNGQTTLPIFSGNFDRFCAAGNDEGLFILVDKNKKDWFPTGEKVEIADFKFNGDHHFDYINGKIVLN